jgi:UDP-3-O-[3-hydroxymyristoyl] glucosamine N-acyltransferase
MDHAVVGAATRLVAHVTLCAGVEVGARCLFHPGVVIGADGFGHAPDANGFVKIPQVGSVRIADDVEIGANSTIDRGAIGDTVVEHGVKIDNQVQVGAQLPWRAHRDLGPRGFRQRHDRRARWRHGRRRRAPAVTDDVPHGQPMVSHSIASPGVFGQLPFDEARRFRRNSARFQHLDELARRVRVLEKGAGPAADDEQDGNDT